MTTDDFTKAARAEAGQYELDKAANIEAWERHPHDQGSRIGFKQGAEWGYDQALAQEPTDAEVEAAAEAICSGEGGCDPCFNWDDSVAGGCTYCTRHARAALSAARAARRDEEKR